MRSRADRLERWMRELSSEGVRFACQPDLLPSDKQKRKVIEPVFNRLTKTKAQARSICRLWAVFLPHKQKHHMAGAC